MKFRSLLALTLTGMLFAAPALAAPEVSIESGLKLEVPWADGSEFEDSILHTYTELDLMTELTDSISGKLGVDLYLHDQVDKPWGSIFDAKTTSETDSAIETVVDEAYLLFTEPFDLPMDLKVGRQYITMGRGDGVTTLNLFAPADLRYITDLAATLPITGVRTDWYWNDFVVTGVVQTKFTTAYYSQKVGDFYQAVEGSVLAAKFPETSFTFQSEVPDLGDGSDLGLGLKVGTNYAGYDLDIVYQHGYIAVPTVKDIDTSQSPVVVTKGYLPMDKVGLTLAGTIKDAGVWAELTYNRPDQDFFAKSLEISDEEYASWLLGADYFFANGAYANIQYVRGLPQEFTEDMVKDYLVLDAYQTFKSDMLKVEGQVIYSLEDGSSALIPEVIYKLNDDLTLSGKAIKFFGNDTDSLGLMKPLSEISLGLSWAI